MSDKLQNGRRIKVMTIVEQHTCEANAKKYVVRLPQAM